MNILCDTFRRFRVISVIYHSTVITRLGPWARNRSYKYTTRRGTHTKINECTRTSLYGSPSKPKNPVPKIAPLLERGGYPDGTGKGVGPSRGETGNKFRRVAVAGVRTD